MLFAVNNLKVSVGWREKEAVHHRWAIDVFCRCCHTRRCHASSVKRVHEHRRRLVRFSIRDSHRHRMDGMH